MLTIRKLRKLIARAGILTLAASSAACTSISFLIANVPASFGPYQRTTDIAYGSEKRQKLDVYVPTDPNAPEARTTARARGGVERMASGTTASSAGDAAPRAPLMRTAAASGASLRPVVIFWYGGSWQDGSKSEYRFVGAALAERGFIAVLPDYRLYPKVKFPDFVDDAAQAVA